MASKVYLIYKTDNQHSYQSRDLLAVVIDHNPIPFIKTHALKTVILFQKMTNII